MKSEQDTLVATFKRVFGTEPTWRVRAPGRVNLIGDHTDYNHLPVFPMAVQRSITMVGRSRPDENVRVANVASNFETVEFELRPNVVRGDTGSWGNYVMAGPRALAEEHGVTNGFDAVVSGDIPVAAGLSSSSALVVASGLAVCLANSMQLPVLDMADLMARAERFVGTQGGGMDQAVCLGAKKSSAVRIDFAPLRLDHVAIPDDWRFIIAHSLVNAEKSGNAQAEYNQRTEACREGLMLVSRAMGQPTANGETHFPALLAMFGSEMVLDVAERTLVGSLKKRFVHTVSEAARVDQAVTAMRSTSRVLFGELMNRSHTSLRDNYDVSIPALDALVQLLRDGGCDGARLTGAGFGGCAVGLCRASNVDDVRRHLVHNFYEPRQTELPLDDVCFIAQPSDGATTSPIA